MIRDKISKHLAYEEEVSLVLNKGEEEFDADEIGDYILSNVPFSHRVRSRKKSVVFNVNSCEETNSEAQMRHDSGQWNCNYCTLGC